MKTRFWIGILVAVLAVSLGLGTWILMPQKADYAQIWQDGELIHTLNLGVDRIIEVRTDHGYNRIEVRGGTISVTAADCPDHYCIDRGFCSSGAPIVCLPNALVIRFVGNSKTDGMAG